eukprot:403370628
MYKFRNLFKSIDMFGQKITLTTYKTSYGASITLLLALTFIAFIAYRLNVLFNKLENQTGRQTQFQDISNNPAMYDIGEYGFDFAIGIRSNIERKYGQLIVEHVTQNRVFNETTNLTAIKFDIKTLEMVYCGVDNLAYDNKEEILLKGVDKYLCIKDKKYLNIGGTFLSKIYKYLLIRFEICNNSTFNNNCAPNEDIRMFFVKNEIWFRFVNSYFDFVDFQQPVKRFIEDRLYFPLKLQHKKIANMFIKRSYTSLYDSLNPLDKPKNLTFVKVDNIQQLESELDWQFPGNLQINIRLDPEFDIYSRQIYSFYNLMFQLGGTYNALLLIGTLLTKFIVIKLLYLDIIQELFYNKKKDNIELAQLANKKNGSNDLETEIIRFMHHIQLQQMSTLRPELILLNKLKAYYVVNHLNDNSTRFVSQFSKDSEREQHDYFDIERTIDKNQSLNKHEKQVIKDLFYKHPKSQLKLKSLGNFQDTKDLHSQLQNILNMGQNRDQSGKILESSSNGNQENQEFINIKKKEIKNKVTKKRTEKNYEIKQQASFQSSQKLIESAKIRKNMNKSELYKVDQKDEKLIDNSLYSPQKEVRSRTPNKQKSQKILKNSNLKQDSFNNFKTGVLEKNLMKQQKSTKFQTQKILAEENNDATSESHGYNDSYNALQNSKHLYNHIKSPNRQIRFYSVKQSATQKRQQDKFDKIQSQNFIIDNEDNYKTSNLKQPINREKASDPRIDLQEGNASVMKSMRQFLNSSPGLKGKKNGKDKKIQKLSEDIFN